MPKLTLKEKLHEVIFEAETPAGKTFDVALLGLIVFSIVVVMLETVETVAAAYGPVLSAAEWIVTALFTLEYLVRLYCVERPTRYVRSFYGIVDLCAILPTYLSLLFAGTESLMVVRGLRLLRIFRVLKLTHYLGEARELSSAIRASQRKITVFLVTVFTLVVIIGALMYLVEGKEHGFTSIPVGIYWAIVTLTTVGFGDIVPRTVCGQMLASVVMIMGYGIIAVPTGIVTVAISRAAGGSTEACKHCGRDGHDTDARFCKYCGGHVAD